MSGQKILAGLKDAVAGNFGRVTIEGQTWVRVDSNPCIDDKSCVIGIRINKAEKRRLAEVARIKGVSLSEFLRSAAVTEAHRVIGPPKLIRTRTRTGEQ